MKGMKIAFVFMGAENLGIEYLSAVARAAGHETRLFFDTAPFSGKLMLDVPALARLTDKRAGIAEAIARWKPDAVAFSCFTGNYLWSLDVAHLLRDKSPGTPLIFGGVHVSSGPEIVIAEDCVDAAFAGEGEGVFLRLVEGLVSGKKTEIPGALIKDGADVLRMAPLPPITDLDALPFPDKALFYGLVPALEFHYMIMAARGCPYSCTYCYKSLDISSSGGAQAVRMRGVENVIEELKPFKKRGKMNMVVFRDDVFGVNKKWLAEFACGYRAEIGFPYFCYTHPESVDAERVALLRESGCVFTTMGIQSADEAVRRKFLNRNYTNERAAESVRLLKEGGIRVSLDHIAGLPEEDGGTLREAALFYSSMRPDRLLTFWLECLPGTKMMDIAIERGMLTKDEADRIRRGYAGYRYSGGSNRNVSGGSARVVNFMNIVPLLPDRVVRWIVGKGFERFMPGNSIFQLALMVVNALKIRDPFFFYNIRFMFSRKRAGVE